MEILLIILFGIIVILCLLAIFYASFYNKFQDYIIRINEVESIIDTNLRTKYDLLNRVIPLIKGNINSDKEIFEEIIKLRSRKISNFELYRVLVRGTIELSSMKNEYPDIQKSSEIKKISKQIDDIDLELENQIDYYNDNISIYNGLLKKFPSNIVSLICKYKEKLYFDRKDMNDDDYNDFKL